MSGKFTDRLRKALLFLLLLATLPLVAAPDNLPYQFVTSALADDDDDDGDDDDDDDHDSRSYGGGNAPPVFRAVRPPRILRELIRPFRNRPANPPRRAAPPAPLPPHAEREIVAMGLSDADLSTLQADGYAVLDQTNLTVLGQSVVKLEVPAGTDLETARQDVRALDAAGIADFNHYYRTSQADGGGNICPEGACWAPVLVRWPDEAAKVPATCNEAVRIGMIDTGINPDHETFAASAIEVMRIVPEEEPASGRQHGTAVAALLVGSPSSRSPGLLPKAELFAVDAFRRAGSGSDRAEVFDLVTGIDHLLARNVSVINMSLAGDANDLLRRAVETGVAEHNVIFVASVGNEGPRADPVYPAGYTEVLAVTAVDRNKRPYRRAVQGEHVDIASPGVDVWTAASIRGARPKTGTSFAAPFVSAAAAMAKASNPALTHEDIEKQLGAAAEDLGEPGKDPVFGWGLLNASTVCGSESQAEPAIVD